jgi:hypothetical protein
MDLGRSDAVVKTLAEQHLQTAGTEQIAILEEIVSEGEEARRRAVH